ncbi:hypothetical protein E5163_14175 [Marinicauda algicola]|uniref:Uncharacterized protein n=1 Tax=Marinicauda algicola TaxID=2029849 RepID=A0A4V3RXS0_9PROT|nr:hypothetical protein [Marinicauda algicola]TGY87579.1 hypothetical protein E5163_14175 [Marinicauda algicola]
MKLTEAQAERIKSQFGAEPLPHDEPALDPIKDAFGEHTFYLDANGLVIFEPVEDQPDAARAVVVAVWTDEKKEQLAGIQPQVTQTVVDFNGANDT